VIDAAAFRDLLSAHIFLETTPTGLARAPGRLDVMGGIADYSGSLVLELPLAAAAWAAVQWTHDGLVHVRTTDAAAAHGSLDVALPLVDLLSDYPAVRRAFAATPDRHWAAYVVGAITVLHRERGVPFDRGVRWLIASDVPAGKGVSSSAAIEVAAMLALCRLMDVSLDGRTLARLCQTVENLVVGAPCGVMDQMTAACGDANALLALRCQPSELEASVPVPAEVELFGIDSGIRHAVSGADYTSVRVGAFMGYRIIASLAGLPATSDGPGRVRIEDDRWHGYLANITPQEWDAEFRDRVPEALTGAAFLDQFGGSTDPVTTIEAGRTYAVRQPTAHPILEHDRVKRFRDLLRGAPDDAALRALGQLMYASHASYSACGLGSRGTDEIVSLVRDAGPAAGLFGAKITGGGSGGTVAVLARRGSRGAIDEIVAEYSRRSGRHATVIAGSSDGALRVGRRQWM